MSGVRNILELLVVALIVMGSVALTMFGCSRLFNEESMDDSTTRSVEQLNVIADSDTNLCFLYEPGRGARRAGLTNIPCVDSNRVWRTEINYNFLYLNVGVGLNQDVCLVGLVQNGTIKSNLATVPCESVLTAVHNKRITVRRDHIFICSEN